MINYVIIYWCHASGNGHTYENEGYFKHCESYKLILQYSSQSRVH